MQFNLSRALRPALNLAALSLGGLLAACGGVVYLSPPGPEPEAVTTTSAAMPAAPLPTASAGPSEPPPIPVMQVPGAQADLMADTIARIARGMPGRPEVFFVGLGGDARQDVFLTESTLAHDLLTQRFAAQDRAALLVNNPATTARLPIADLVNLRDVVVAMGARMNREEDVLVLFMTSHGDPRHNLALDFPPLKIEDLNPAALKAILDEAGIQWRVIIVSACYSGGYVPVLADERTLIVTAAARDRTSFGCSDDAVLTFFGRAYLDHAMRAGHGFVSAHEAAQMEIRNWENAEGYIPSNPQISVGRLMPEKLKAIEAAARSARPAGPTQ
ncbi:C13 family peptidase [Zavarzinia sp. CC-PAN008]|uniref:C13 family peptidase n=1 Tax=Zavarzinia sp. CC-PAN008 TaxID=3243332 RepID=UPI003F748860